MDHLMKYPT